MTDLAYTVVDAFADRPFTGNPAAVMPLTEWLPDELMQAIAMEHALSETAFTIPCADGVADYELRWFTPTVEAMLCGHATLASGHALLAATPGTDRLRFRTRHAGVLEVARASDGYEMSLPAWRAEPRPLPEVVAALGCAAEETLWHDSRYAIVRVADETIVRNLRPDFHALGAAGDVLTIVTAPGRETDIVSRVFATGAGIDEDPVTGSAHSMMTPYWCERLGRESFSAYQASRRGGHLTCRLAGDRAVLTGRCVTVMEGVVRL